MYLYISSFSYFLYKKITGDSTPLTQKERCPKRYPNLFFKGHSFVKVSHSVYTLLPSKSVTILAFTPLLFPLSLYDSTVCFGGCLTLTE